MVSQTEKSLPPNLSADKNMQALCGGMDAALPFELLPNLLVYDVDNVHVSVLPFLAWQFHVDCWELANTEEKQQRIIKNSILYHQHKGTVWIIKRILADLGYENVVIKQRQPAKHNKTIKHDGTVKYSDSVNWARFKVIITTIEPVAEEKKPLIEKLILEYKRLSNHLTGVEYFVAIMDVYPSDNVPYPDDSTPYPG